MKRWLCILITLTLALGLLSTTAYAKSCDLVRLDHMVYLANDRIDTAIWVAQQTKKDDVAFLLWRVERITQPVFAYADRIGATVVCDYETYWIDGRYVEVDPLRVVS